MEIKDLARLDWEQGMKYREISAKHGVPEGTVKAWAARYWKPEKVATKVATKSKKVATQKTQPDKPPTIDQQMAAAVEENEELTLQQKDFCLYFSRTRNATQAYLKAYGCAYNTAHTNGPALLANTCIQTELRRLREIKIAALGDLCGEDVVNLRARIAFADITDFVEFRDGVVSVKDSGQVDGQLISEISEGPKGVKVKLEGRDKALEFLAEYLGVNAGGPADARESNLFDAMESSAAALEGLSDAL